MYERSEFEDEEVERRPRNGARDGELVLGSEQLASDTSDQTGILLVNSVNKCLL